MFSCGWPTQPRIVRENCRCLTTKVRIASPGRGARCRVPYSLGQVPDHVPNTEQATTEAVRVVAEIDAAAAEMRDAPPPDSRLPRRPTSGGDLLYGAGLVPSMPHLEDYRSPRSTQVRLLLSAWASCGVACG